MKEDIQKTIRRLIELHKKNELDPSEIGEVESGVGKVLGSLETKEGNTFDIALAKGFRLWKANSFHQTLASSMEGLSNLRDKAITDEQLDAVIDMNEMVIRYLGSRMNGSDIFTAGLIMELKSLKELKKLRDSESNEK